MTRRPAFLTASIAAGALALASCGTPEEDPAPISTSATPSSTVEEETNSEESNSPEPSPEDTETDAPADDSSQEETSAPEEEPSPAEEASDGSQAEGESHHVDRSEFSRETTATEGFPGTPGAPAEIQHLVEVRVGQHEGYDRVVFEHNGPSELGYQVEYVDSPTDPQLAEPIDVPGEAFISIGVAGLGLPTSNFDSVLSGPIEGVDTRSQLVYGVHALSPFEAQSTYFIGVDQQRDFRVQVLEDPVRLVVDLAH
ncbi:AMIN-like domain-containing (lipo)protein [Nesterenkonia halotolerans]|uniref:AMIN-like domain-containing protein n=1 Tax=Nesterenkonia halotolerans TaxID=225325 RepID=A0ABR9J841_9MICC|nr:hypothetical protein [Nesterenkonia halotolerans]MBE1515162.1 hypothetical protein [Nesterenkonia halotolerans]